MPQVPQVQRAQSSTVPVAMTIKTLMSNDSVKARFNEILGKKSAGFISSVLSVSNTQALIGSDPKTILSAAVVAATLDLPINPNLGFAYIVPYNNKGNKQAQFQMGYKGFIQLAQRSGQYKTINATDVREGELISNNILTGEVTIKALDKDRDKAKVIGYAAYFELNNGFSKTMYMSREDMDAHAKRYSQSYRNDKYGTSLWNTQFDTMARKTVLKLLLSTFGPLTIDTQMAKAISFDQASMGNSDNIEDEGYVVEEADYVDNPENQEPEEPKVQTMPEGKKAAMEAASSLFPEEGKTNNK